MSNGGIQALLAESGFEDAAEPLGDSMFRMEWEAATLVIGAAGESVVVIAPLFDQLPANNDGAFLRRLLELNSEMGGTASFAVQSDGAVVLQVGRGLQGLDAGEFSLLIGTVGRFANEYREPLKAEFY